MEAIAIKNVETADLDAAIFLFDAQLREHDIFTPTNDLYEVAHAVLADSSLGFLLVAMVGNAPTGVLYAAAHLSLEHGGTVGWLEELYVLPEKRGLGIGSRLLTEMIDRARQLRWRAIELEVVAGHERTVPLYLRHAFKPVSRSRFNLTFSTES